MYLYQILAVLVFLFGLSNTHSNTVYATRSASGRVSYTNTPVSKDSILLLRSTMPSSRPVEKAIRSPRADSSIPLELDGHIRDAALLHDVEAHLISAVIRIESGFNRRAVSPKGARGLMQLMPETAKRYGAFDLHDARTNVLAGTAYLRDLISMFDGRLDLALAGYNAGENAVRKYNNSIPPYPETRHYVSAVLAEYRRLVRSG